MSIPPGSIWNEAGQPLAPAPTLDRTRLRSQKRKSESQQTLMAQPSMPGTSKNCDIEDFENNDGPKETVGSPMKKIKVDKMASLEIKKASGSTSLNLPANINNNGQKPFSDLSQIEQDSFYARQLQVELDNPQVKSANSLSQSAVKKGPGSPTNSQSQLNYYDSDVWMDDDGESSHAYTYDDEASEEYDELPHWNGYGEFADWDDYDHSDDDNVEPFHHIRIAKLGCLESLFQDIIQEYNKNDPIKPYSSLDGNPLNNKATADVLPYAAPGLMQEPKAYNTKIRGLEADPDQSARQAANTASRDLKVAGLEIATPSISESPPPLAIELKDWYLATFSNIKCQSCGNEPSIDAPALVIGWSNVNVLAQVPSSPPHEPLAFLKQKRRIQSNWLFPPNSSGEDKNKSYGTDNSANTQSQETVGKMQNMMIYGTSSCSSCKFTICLGCGGSCEATIASLQNTSYHCNKGHLFTLLVVLAAMDQWVSRGKEEDALKRQADIDSRNEKAKRRAMRTNHHNIDTNSFTNGLSASQKQANFYGLQLRDLMSQCQGGISNSIMLESRLNEIMILFVNLRMHKNKLAAFETQKTGFEFSKKTADKKLQGIFRTECDHLNKVIGNKMASLAAQKLKFVHELISLIRKPPMNLSSLQDSKAKKGPKTKLKNPSAHPPISPRKTRSMTAAMSRVGKNMKEKLLSKGTNTSASEYSKKAPLAQARNKFPTKTTSTDPAAESPLQKTQHKEAKLSSMHFYNPRLSSHRRVYKRADGTGYGGGSYSSGGGAFYDDWDSEDLNDDDFFPGSIVNPSAYFGNNPTFAPSTPKFSNALKSQSPLNPKATSNRLSGASDVDSSDITTQPPKDLKNGSHIPTSHFLAPASQEYATRAAQKSLDLSHSKISRANSIKDEELGILTTPPYAAGSAFFQAREQAKTQKPEFESHVFAHSEAIKSGPAKTNGTGQNESITAKAGTKRTRKLQSKREMDRAPSPLPSSKEPPSAVALEKSNGLQLANLIQNNSGENPSIPHYAQPKPQLSQNSDALSLKSFAMDLNQHLTKHHTTTLASSDVPFGWPSKAISELVSSKGYPWLAHTNVAGTGPPLDSYHTLDKDIDRDIDKISKSSALFSNLQTNWIPSNTYPKSAFFEALGPDSKVVSHHLSSQQTMPLFPRHNNAGLNHIEKVNPKQEHHDLVLSNIFKLICAVLPDITSPSNHIISEPNKMEVSYHRFLSDCNLSENTLLTILQSSFLSPMMEELLRNDSITDISKRSDLYLALLQLMRHISQNSHLASFLSRPREGNSFSPNMLKFFKDQSTPCPLDSSSTALFSLFEKLVRQARVILKGFGQAQLIGDNDEDDVKTMGICLEVLNVFEGIGSIVEQPKKPVPKVAESNERVTRSGANIKGKKRAIIESIEELRQRRIKMHQDLSFDYIPSFAETHYHFTTIKALQHSPKGRLMHLSKELATLATSLPEGIFLRVCDDRPDVMRCLITGPDGTPYEGGLFEFDVWCGEHYPNEPPKVQLKTTGGGVIGFNPNLYPDGKVCLSILGTWSGAQSEMWQPKTSSLLQVFVSIQSMIFCSKPYYNEPGRHEPASGKDECSDLFNNYLKIHTVRLAMLQWLSEPARTGIWKDIIKAHFTLNAEKIISTATQWSKEVANIKNYDSRDVNVCRIQRSQWSKSATKDKKGKNLLEELETAIYSL
ncbi:MAG: hypothetical protein M1829_006099 [Trizodia sp. TS-e1964]|nr:MAG: hypothetical protein M1829_006099 [Trizodia sp. TS-e1964]